MSYLVALTYVLAGFLGVTVILTLAVGIIGALFYSYETLRMKFGEKKALWYFWTGLAVFVILGLSRFVQIVVNTGGTK